LKRLNPDVLLGMGSFAAVPPCLALYGMKVPLVLHEGNAWMGKANRLALRRASAIGLSMPLARPEQAKGCRAVQVGMPLRQAIVDAANGVHRPLEECRALYGLTADRKTVLVFGGSQGARSVNELVMANLPLLKDVSGRLQFIHLTGTDDNQALIQAYADAGIPACVKRLDPDIEQCYLCADLVICRSGASSICELALFGKPLILIPLPWAADDHQTANAKTLEAIGAACHLAQKTATPEKLAALIRQWLDNPAEWDARGQALKAIAQPDATAKLCALLEEQTLSD
jgi:UDP-N-acetylglucosamine--N-acetylmuramyl-(pentapeptide) pyrophosphoryl-undecaprenol N-acetylglucosamine transferase